MITFKEFLFEKMAPSSYAATFKRLGEDARIGFEIEVFVPSGTFFHADPDEATSKGVELKDIGTWSEIQTYFEVSKQQEGGILNEFDKWKTEKEDDWVDGNYRDFMDDEDDTSRGAVSAAKKAALKHITNSFTFDQWLKLKFEGLADFIATYELEPNYGWATETSVFAMAPTRGGYMSGFKNTATQLAGYLARELKEKVVVNGSGYTFWNLTHDTSIKDSEGRDDESDQDGYGVEIVSPPLAPAKAMEQLALVFNILDKYEIETNESTGIHVNISLENMDHFDPLKLVLFMGDEHILKKFDRMANTYTLSQIKRVIDSISLTGTVPKSVDELMKLGREGLKETGKYFSVNLQHLPKYLEFRAAGGANYHKRLNDIREVTGRWLTAVEIAADPDKYRQQYLKKVMKLIDKTSEGQTKQEVSDMTFMEYLRKNERMFADMLDDAKSSDDQELKVKTLRSIMMELGSKLDKLRPIPFSWLKDVRALFSSMGVSGHDVLQASNLGEARSRVQAALSAFKMTKPS